MALLSEKQRNTRLKYLGYGPYNRKSVLEFQKDAFPNNKKLHDGIYGKLTDYALRTWYNVKKYGGGYFKPTEFTCKCGHCTGYPTFMKRVEIKHLARIRKHYGKPMTITSGIRCEIENRNVGGIQGSSHTKGYAVDFYMKGVTDTVEHRKKALEWIEKQPNHEFTYGAYMKDSQGKYREAAQMGNAMHTETHRPEKKGEKSKYYSSSTKIGEARCNEKGQIYGGQPGDQTGKEVCIGNWYDGGWTHVYRAKDPAVRLKIAQAMKETCGNDCIGYNASPPNRYAAWDNAEANGHQIAKISKKGDTTCSEAVSMCMRAAGIPKAYAPRHCDIAAYERVMKNNPYFDVFTAKAFLRSGAKLEPGDMCLSSHHVVAVVSSPNA